MLSATARWWEQGGFRSFFCASFCCRNEMSRREQKTTRRSSGRTREDVVASFRTGDLRKHCLTIRRLFLGPLLLAFLSPREISAGGGGPRHHLLHKEWQAGAWVHPGGIKRNGAFGIPGKTLSSFLEGLAQSRRNSFGETNYNVSGKPPRRPLSDPLYLMVGIRSCGWLPWLRDGNGGPVRRANFGCLVFG